MFEIPDDDEHLFDDIPLDDITNKKHVEDQVLDCRPQLRVPESQCIGNTTKQLCSGGDNDNRRECNTSPENVGPFGFNRDLGARVSPNETNTSFNDSRRLSTSGTPVVATRTVTAMRQTDGQMRASSVSSVDPGGDHITPKRKRKFPGPAGLLPVQDREKTMDMKTVISETPQQAAPVQEGREPSMALSQSSQEDTFSDVPWQAMLSDLGEDGLKLMKKFSIGATLLKASKKQLYQGKAPLLCGVIDMMESHGSEASITLRDRSGKMQGTVHRDLLKEYEVELQIGTVLVLKQVSLISVSNRNHYLNITPANLVCLYHSRHDRLTTLRFHGSQESLHSVLSALEKKAAAARRSMDGSLTPRSNTGSSRASLSDRSSTGTPVLPGSLPTTPDLNQRLSRVGTPYASHTSSRLTPQTLGNMEFPTPAVGVRDVSVVTPGSVPVTPSGFGNPRSVPLATPPCPNPNGFGQGGVARGMNNSGHSNTPVGVPVTPSGYGHGGGMNNSGVPKAPAGGRLSSLLGSKNLSAPGNAQTYSNSNGNAGVQGSTMRPNHGLQNQNQNSSRVGDGSGVFAKNGRDTNNTGAAPAITNPQTNNSWSFQNAPATPQNVAMPRTPLPVGNSAGRSCQLSATTPSAQTPDINTQASRKSKWSFKSRTSPNNGSPGVVPVQTTTAPGTKITEKGGGQAVVATEDMWDDDLNDEILSQLSDDMT